MLDFYATIDHLWPLHFYLLYSQIRVAVFVDFLVDLVDLILLEGSLVIFLGHRACLASCYLYLMILAFDFLDHQGHSSTADNSTLSYT